MSDQQGYQAGYKAGRKYAGDWLLKEAKKHTGATREAMEYAAAQMPSGVNRDVRSTPNYCQCNDRTCADEVAPVKDFPMWEIGGRCRKAARKGEARAALKQD